MCVGDLPECMSVHHVYGRGQKEDTRSSGMGITGHCEHRVGAMSRTYVLWKSSSTLNY